MMPDPSPSPTRLMIPTPGPATWDVIAQWLAIGLLTTGTVIFVAFVAEKLVSSDKKREIKPFYLWIAAIAFFGGLLSFFLPIAINSGFNKEDDGARLRQALLYTTGGLLGVITLGETHRKNDLEKEKNEQDHTRQMYAERRSRYTKAIEQLADEKATVRLGGIYTLVGLVDEWLTDDTLNPKERQKEGQVIINNLCSYIRSPFLVLEKIEEYEAYKVFKKFETKNAKLKKAEYRQILDIFERFIDSDEYEKPKDITTDYANFHEEQDVRRTIFVEMSKRSSIVQPTGDGKVSVTPGPWSSFNFDFSRAPIFYPLSELTIEEANFASARFYDESSFSKAIFARTADFSGAKFTRTADFWSATFTQTADFSGAEFTRTADFSWAKFTQTTNFSWAKFTETADFRSTIFTEAADFRSTIFTEAADFRSTTFTEAADFWSTTFTEAADFRDADFRAATFGTATFTKIADFRSTTFTEAADFRSTTFTEAADFRAATFNLIAWFSGAIFKSIACFSEVTFEKYSPLFVTTSDKSGKTYRTRFAVLSDNLGEHEFTVREGSKLIEPGKATLRGKPFIIPVGTVLFDWDDERQGYITSEPAEPLDNSSAGEENITE